MINLLNPSIFVCIKKWTRSCIYMVYVHVTNCRSTIFYFHLHSAGICPFNWNMQGITRLFNSSARLSLLKNNASLVSAVYKTNSMHFPNFLKSDSPTYCCMWCVGYKSRRGRYSEEKFDWEIDHPFDDDSKVEMDTEVFTDEGRTRYHFMLKGFGVMCYIFFCNLGYFIRLRLNELKRGKPKTTSWRESVYWENKGFTGFMTLSYLLGKTCLSMTN